MSEQTAAGPLTVRQYVAAVARCKAAPEDMRHQVQAWPYPQARQSHIAFWRESWPHEPLCLPDRQVRVMIANSDCPGDILRVASDAPRPAEVAEALSED